MKLAIKHDIYLDYIVVHLIKVIWSIYSSDRMKTLIRMLRTMTETSCGGSAKCKMFNIYLIITVIFLIIFRHFVELPAQKLNKIIGPNIKTLKGN